MKFEHLIEVNDLNNMLIAPLSREQLWQGLVLRAEQPELFMPHLDRCIITQKHEAGCSRELHFGELKIIDHVMYNPMQTVQYHVPTQNDIPQSTLKMRIEEPQPNALFVRFLYDDGYDNTSDAQQAMYNEYKKSAYYEADLETVRIIREQIRIAG